MSDLAALIEAHSWAGMIYTPPKECCDCGWEGEEHAEHLAEVIQAARWRLNS